MNKHDEYVMLYKSLKNERSKKIEVIISSLVNLYSNQLHNRIIKDLESSVRLYTTTELDEFIENEFQLTLTLPEIKSIYLEANKVLISPEYGFKIREVNVGSPELYIEVK